MYPNLRAEIARKGMSLCDFAKAVGMAYQTLRAKINGFREFTYPEVVMIRNYLNPEISIEYLFVR